MLRKLTIMFAFVFLAFGVLAPSALAAVTLNPDGTGFVGKGDVQTALGLNNKALQDLINGYASGSITFTVVSVTETTWNCIKPNPVEGEAPLVQERSRETSIQGVSSVIARERNQITGFILTGFVPGSTITTTTEGPKLGSCANAKSGYLFDASSVETSPVGGQVLRVNGVPLQ